MSNCHTFFNEAEYCFSKRDTPDIKRRYWEKAGLWHRSNFAGSVGGAPLKIVKQYIEQQNTLDQYSFYECSLYPPLERGCFTLQFDNFYYEFTKAQI